MRRPRFATWAVLLLTGVLSSGAADAKDPPPAWPWTYPGGESTQTIEGLKVTLYVPRRLTPQSGSSLLVLLHGARAQGANLATFFRFWPRRNYVVVAPQASGPVWQPADLERVRRIVHVLRAKLPINADRLHVAGFSNGASNLHAVAFAQDMKARSGTWVGGGFGGGDVPGWAKERFGALFMSGTLDFALDRVRRSPDRLRGRVRSVELHIEPDIGHTWPTSQIEYHLWWMGVQEGRFDLEGDMNFDWSDDLDEALQMVKRREAPGAFLYLYDSVSDKVNDDARTLQTRTFMDPEVRRWGRRLQAVMIDKRGNSAALAKLGIPAMATPAVVVFDARGNKTFFSGAIPVAELRQALASALQ